MSDEHALQAEAPSAASDGLYDETVVYKHDMWRYLGEGDFNPEDISFATFKKMKREDSQVNAAIRILVLATLARGYEVHYEGKNPELGADMVGFLDQVFSEVNTTQWRQGGLYQWMEEEIETALSYGFAATEMVYTLTEYNGESKIGLKKLKIVPPSTVENGLLWDKFGDLNKIIQTVSGNKNELELDRILMWSYRMEGSNWYGQSDMRQIYKNWYIKEYITKMWNIAIERYGTPILLGKVRNKKDLDMMNSILDSVRTKTNLSVVKGDEVDAIEMKTTGDAFESAIRYNDSKIMIGLLVPTLLLSQEDVGARALGATHMEIFLLRLKSIQNELGEVLDQLIKILIDFNFTNIDKYPEIVFRELSSIDKLNLAKMLEILISAQVVAPDEMWIRKHLGIPERGSLENPINEPVTDVPAPEAPEELSVKKELTAITWDENPKDVEKELDKRESKMARPIRSYLASVDDYLNSNIEELMKNPGSLDLPKVAERNVKMTVAAMTDAFEYGQSSAKKIIDSMKDDGSKAGLQGPGWFQDRGFYIYSSMEARLIDELSMTLGTALDQGFTIDELEARFTQIIDNEEFSSRGVSAIVRTNVNAAFNVGRVELFKRNSDFVKGVRYSAIMDSRTSPFCSEHHDMILKLDDPRLSDISPPNHMLCRSYLVGVTVIDEPIEFNWKDGKYSPDPGFGPEATSVGDLG